MMKEELQRALEFHEERMAKRFVGKMKCDVALQAQSEKKRKTKKYGKTTKVEKATTILILEVTNKNEVHRTGEDPLMLEIMVFYYYHEKLISS